MRNKAMNSINQPMYWIVGLISIMSLFLYQLLDEGLLSSFVKDLGIAGIIALILTFTIEMFNRERHSESVDQLVDMIHKNLFEAIYKRFIPNEIFSEVEKCLLNSEVYRTGHEVSYSLEAVPAHVDDKIDKEKHLFCTATSFYNLHNATNADIFHDVILRLERPVNESWDDYCKVTKAMIGSVVLSEEQIAEHCSTNPVHITLKYRVKIAGRASIEVRTEAKLIKQRTDQEIWTSRLPSDGFDLTVTTSDSSLEVNAFANHHEKLEENRFNDLATRWKLNHGIFPHQSVAFWWKDKG